MLRQPEPAATPEMIGVAAATATLDHQMRGAYAYDRLTETGGRNRLSVRVSNAWKGSPGESVLLASQWRPP
jgi:hypothetical protein